MRRVRISTVSSSVRIGGKPFALWTEATPTANTEGDVVGTTVWAGDGSDSTIDVRGRVAVVRVGETRLMYPILPEFAASVSALVAAVNAALR